MKTLISIVLLTALAVSCSRDKQNDQKSDDIQRYQKNDLRKISWIEGNWRGTHEGKHFYELYRFSNDSTLEIFSYEWNGQDSSHTSKSYVAWTDNAYFLGENKNWKVTEVTESSIYMLPKNKAANDILWRFKDANSWEAILKTPKKENAYLMERVETF